MSLVDFSSAKNSLGIGKICKDVLIQVKGILFVRAICDFLKSATSFPKRVAARIFRISKFKQAKF